MFRSMLMVLILVVGLAGCVSSGGYNSYELSPVERILCVEDRSAGYGALTVKVRNGPMFFPDWGRRTCKKVSLVGNELVATVSSIGGGLNGGLDSVVRMTMADSDCMVWIIRSKETAENSLVPCFFKG